MQVLNRVSIILALVSFVAVVAIFAVLVGRGDGVGYAFVIASVVFVCVVPVSRLFRPKCISTAL